MNPPEPKRSTAARSWALKYLVEWLLAAGLIALLAPLLVVIAVLVKLTSRGPVLYASDRLGKDGGVFRLFKFRSMNVGVEQVIAEDGQVITRPDDPRFTPIGKWLRVGFDELPQLFNILRGDMCLIGPRPDVPWEFERYTPHQKMRLDALPGITGLAQVMDGRRLNNAQNYDLDVYYVRQSSFRMDLMILLATLPYALGLKAIGSKVFPQIYYTVRSARGLGLT